ncbi:uncharacterized protein LOC114717954 [Neltuma alba]|uniref:uncharacterized protein LOC114717954 n=1 Tax=Neltuma alba TaxID=207710 RepID=UPI0010A30D97|nr:uncharacterized protein LOC114717098 isoform X2 [Prosopis alba]XP_028758025.1 uncharacterized protein LOC114717098 isoform X2 [Prosopis alba]XP_028759038.1 uncharacterized protein LOC114717954 [Prosopis alba]XP_028759039.1 uncharacterized protein LOC114717954 [Prosopis alba]XP_028759040.1 uncharacterized protein LOC114717954 [Prosopis alba]XP_028759041.1 uncharacterized protein LOC114717954 [Prosopis alba]
MEIGRGGSSFSYYTILGISSDSTSTEIRRAYRKLALQWHPDRWTRTPSLLSEAKQKFQQIQEAYSVLSDHKKRTVYDAGLYDPEDEDEGFSEFMEEMVSLMAQVRREEKDYYSMEELQSMFTEMAQDFNQSPSWRCGASVIDESPQSAKRIRLEKHGRT